MFTCCIYKINVYIHWHCVVKITCNISGLTENQMVHKLNFDCCFIILIYYFIQSLLLLYYASAPHIMFLACLCMCLSIYLCVHLDVERVSILILLSGFSPAYCI